MKTFIAATGLAALASTPGAVATTAMPWRAEPTTTLTTCNYTITANDVTKQCGTVDNPCIMKTGRGTALAVCNKLYRLGVNYDNKYNATIVAKVAAWEDITPASVQFAVGQMGWQRLCPFQCAATPHQCVAFPQNCTDSNVHPHTETSSGHLIAGNAYIPTDVTGVATAAVQWMPHGHTNDTASGNVTLVANATSFNDTTVTATRWTSADTACTGQSFSSADIYNNTLCGATRFNPCPVYGNFTCGSVWKADFFAPAYVPPSSADAHLCTSDAKCARRIESKFVRIVRNGAPLNATIVAGHSLWVSNLCPYLCRKAPTNPVTSGQNVEICVKDADACADGLLVPNTIETLGTWENMQVNGSLNAINPMYLTSLEWVSSSVRAGAISTALLIAVGLFANM